MSTRLVPVLVLSVAWLLTACGGAAPPPHHYAVQADADPIMPTPAAVDPAPVRAAPRVAAARPAVKPRPEPPPTLAVPARVELPDAPLRTFRDWSEYLHDHRFVCSGERGLLVAPVALRFRHGRATLHGWHLDWHAPDGHPEHSVTLGVLGATKDAYPGTLANLDHFLAAFAQEGVDVIIVAGDIGYAPEDIAKVLERLALSGRLVVAITGNAEPIRSFHSAIIDVTRRHQNLIDGNLVRLIAAKNTKHDPEGITARHLARQRGPRHRLTPAHPSHRSRTHPATTPIALTRHSQDALVRSRSVRRAANRGMGRRLLAGPETRGNSVTNALGPHRSPGCAAADGSQSMG